MTNIPDLAVALLLPAVIITGSAGTNGCNLPEIVRATAALAARTAAF